jgi:hypothetical protein
MTGTVPMTDMLTLDRRGTERWTPLRVIASGAMAFAVAMSIGRFALTPILPAVQRSVGLSTYHASLLASANYAGYLFTPAFIVAASVVLVGAGSWRPANCSSRTQARSWVCATHDIGP